MSALNGQAANLDKTIYFNDSLVTDLSCKIMQIPPNEDMAVTIGMTDELRFSRLVILVISKIDFIITPVLGSVFLKISFNKVVINENEIITAQIFKTLIAELVIEEMISGFTRGVFSVLTLGLKILFITIAIKAFAKKQDVKIIMPAFSSL